MPFGILYPDNEVHQDDLNRPKFYEGGDLQLATGEHTPLRATGTDGQAIPNIPPQGEQQAAPDDLPREAEDPLPDQLDTNK